MQANILILHPHDNVAVALAALAADETATAADGETGRARLSRLLVGV